MTYYRESTANPTPNYLEPRFSHFSRFYKEEVVGETRNYINSRAKYEGKTALKAMEEVSKETAEAYSRVSEILDGRGQYARAWHEYVVGYVAMHLTMSRYLFADIDLDDRFSSP